MELPAEVDGAYQLANALPGSSDARIRSLDLDFHGHRVMRLFVAPLALFALPRTGDPQQRVALSFALSSLFTVMLNEVKTRVVRTARSAP
jgi:hypothetical protein